MRYNLNFRIGKTGALPAAVGLAMTVSAISSGTASAATARSNIGG